MSEKSRIEHWDEIYNTKELQKVGWYQKVPGTSLQLITELNLPKDASIIDIGGGDSFLAPTLLDLGYTDITVLDLSAKAIERAKERLGQKANKINWLVSDITEFIPTRKYDCWHDRAAFHFLIKDEDIEKYEKIATKAINANGNLIIGTFSLEGPKKCSDLPITQYSKESLSKIFSKNFELKSNLSPVHTTPGGGKQQFIFCGFKRISSNPK